MATVIVNCFHWIGFHFVEKLLERGDEVIGVHKNVSDKASFLSMFVSRNSLFTHKTTMPEGAERTIVIGCTDTLPKSPSIIQCVGQKDSKNVHTKSHAYIQMPLLFGEWMPMNERGIYVHNKDISFESEHLINHAVYVEDYIISCLQVFDEEIDRVNDEKSNEPKELILENAAYFRDNSTKRENIKKMQKHYVQYASFYYE